jgi:hypothetical protein
MAWTRRFRTFTRQIGGTLIALVLAVAVGPAVNAQGPEPSRLVIHSAGNFLGQLDGFCDDPGGTYDRDDTTLQKHPCRPGGPGGQAGANATAAQDWPAALGGLLGVLDWLKKSESAPPADESLRRAASTPLLLVGGNNQIPEFGVLAQVSFEEMTAKRTATAGAAEIQFKKLDPAIVPRIKRASSQMTFWTVMQQMKPDAIALGPEDFIRSLRAVGVTSTQAEGDRARRFVDWVRRGGGDGLDLPFLASNVVVKTEREGMNVVKSGKYELDAAKDESIGWVHTLTITHPAGSHATFELREFDAAPATGKSPAASVAPERLVATTSKTDDDGEKTTLTIVDGTLRPAKSYRLSVTLQPAPATGALVFTFSTHAALMPEHLQEGLPLDGAGALLRGFPVLWKQLAGQVSGEQLLIVSLLSPNVKLSLGDTAWTWTEGTATKRHIDIIPPADALDLLLRQVAAQPSARRPFIVLISELEDKETLRVLDQFPEVRVALVPPESRILGRAARATEIDAEKNLVAARFSARAAAPGQVPLSFSGDLGFSAIANGDEPSATLVLARPEWIGETGARIDLRMQRNADEEWLVDHATAQVDTVTGVPLDYSVQGGHVTYWPQGRRELAVDDFTPYTVCPMPPAAGTECEDYRKIWTDQATFAAVARDAIKTAAHADIAVIPTDIVDRYAHGWLKHALTAGTTDWISRFILERTLFRSYRFVRADVAGDALLATITAIQNDPLGNESQFCISGFGSAECPSAISLKRPDRLRIDGLPFDAKRYYTIVLPDSLAEKLDLTHKDKVSDSLDTVRALDEYLVGELWRTARSDTPLSARLEQRTTRSVSSFWNVSKLDFGYSSIVVREPPNRKSSLQNVPVDFAGAKTRNTWSVDLDSDLTPVQTPQFALRVPTTIAYHRVRDSEGIFSYDPDQFVVGPRIESRLLKMLSAKPLRFFGGFLWEGPLEPHTERFFASRTAVDTQRAGFKTSEQASFETDMMVQRNIYSHATVGAEVFQLASVPVKELVFNVKRASFDYSKGYAARVPEELKVGPDGLTVGTLTAACPESAKGSLATLLTGDAKGLLNAYFACFPDALTSTTPLVLTTAGHSQSRFQLDLDGDVAIPLWWTHQKAKGALTFVYRRYDATGQPELALHQSLDLTIEFTMPLMWRLQFVPTWQYQRAEINATQQSAFSVRRFEVHLRLPVFLRFGHAGFIE